MTEKRFINIAKEPIFIVVNDTLKAKVLVDDDVVECLNALHEEKEQLKQQNKKLFKMIKITDKIITEYMPLEVVYEWKNGLNELRR